MEPLSERSQLSERLPRISTFGTRHTIVSRYHGIAFGTRNKQKSSCVVNANIVIFFMISTQLGVNVQREPTFAIVRKNSRT